MQHRSWPSGHRARTAAATSAVVLLLALLNPGIAGAQTIRGDVPGNETVTSGSWGAVATPTTMTWTPGGGSNQTTTVTNTGTIALTGLTYKVTVSAGSGTTSFSLQTCARPWNNGGHCPGRTITAIGGSYALGSVTTVNSSSAPAPAGAIYVEATASGAVATTVTMTLQISVTSVTQVRAPIVNNQ
jgi:hypothetical protein